MKRKWRMRKNKYYSIETHRLAHVIYLFMACHSRGLEIMLGDAPFPESEDIAAMVVFLRGRSAGIEDLGTRIQSSGGRPYEMTVVENAEEIEKIIANAGGIDRISEVVRDCRNTNIHQWQAMEDWVRNVTPGRPSCGSKPVLPSLSRKYAYHSDTLRRHREVLLLQIADEVLFGDGGAKRGRRHEV